MKPFFKKTNKSNQHLFHSLETCQNNNIGTTKGFIKFCIFSNTDPKPKQRTVEPATSQPNRGKCFHVSFWYSESTCSQLHGWWGRACPTQKGTKLVQQVEQHQELAFHHLRQQCRGFLQVLWGVKLLRNFFFYFWTSWNTIELQGRHQVSGDIQL